MCGCGSKVCRFDPQNEEDLKRVLWKSVSVRGSPFSRVSVAAGACEARAEAGLDKHYWPPPSRAWSIYSKTKDRVQRLTFDCRCANELRLPPLASFCHFLGVGCDPSKRVVAGVLDRR